MHPEGTPPPAPAGEQPLDGAGREITGLLSAWRGGDEGALAELMAVTYRTLKEIASRLIAGERADHTLQTTALVHEAYLRLAELDRMPWVDRAHFFAMSARVMRRVLIDHARHHARDRRGGGARRIALDEVHQDPSVPPPDLLAVDHALSELATHDPERARIVELRFFGGLNREEIAEVLGISSATVTRRWRSARAWLVQRLAASEAG